MYMCIQISLSLYIYIYIIHTRCSLSLSKAPRWRRTLNACWSLSRGCSGEAKRPLPKVVHSMQAACCASFLSLRPPCVCCRGCGMCWASQGFPYKTDEQYMVTHMSQANMISLQRLRSQRRSPALSLIGLVSPSRGSSLLCGGTSSRHCFPSCPM